MGMDYVRLEWTHGCWAGMWPQHWEDYCRLARLYGWTGRAWCESGGPYAVTAAQAAELAEALERSLGDIPDHDARTPEMIPDVAPAAEQAASGELREDPARPPSLQERFSGDLKWTVGQLAEFCLCGAFTVQLKAH
jgi:hypothetical protein